MLPAKDVDAAVANAAASANFFILFLQVIAHGKLIEVSAMGTQDFPLPLPNHETTLNAKPISTLTHVIRSFVVKFATLKVKQATPGKVP